jgi:hypothetical protein
MFVEVNREDYPAGESAGQRHREVRIQEEHSHRRDILTSVPSLTGFCGGDEN